MAATDPSGKPFGARNREPILVAGGHYDSRMKTASLFASVFAVWLTAAGAHAATTYYVATTGNDGSAGSMAAPFRTITRGAGVAQSGDTVYVRGGTYTQAANITKSGTAAA